MVNIYAPGHSNRNPYSEQGNRFARGTRGSLGGGYRGSGFGMAGTPSGARAGRGGGGGYGRGGLGGSYQNAQTSANAANEQRYRDILGGYKGLRNRNNARVSQLGQQERRDIGERFQGELSGQQANFRRRGLGGTSLASGAAMSSRRRESDAIGGLNERLLRTSIGQDSADTERIGSFMERREDEGPDINQLIGLSSQNGQGAGGGGGAPMFLGGGYGGGGHQMMLGGGGGGYRRRGRTRMRPRNLNSLRYTGNTSASMGVTGGSHRQIAASEPFIQGQLNRYSNIA